MAASDERERLRERVRGCEDAIHNLELAVDRLVTIIRIALPQVKLGDIDVRNRD